MRDRASVVKGLGDPHDGDDAEVAALVAHHVAPER
jgi:hypothetical protein